MGRGAPTGRGGVRSGKLVPAAIALAVAAASGLVAAAFLLASGATAAVPDEAPTCKVPSGGGGGPKPAYAYSGLSVVTPAHGIAATISTVQPPTVPAGTYVAAWVGVSSHLGWLQTGIADSPHGRSLYYEYRQGPSGSAVCFGRLALDPAAPHRFTVLETASAAGVWRVWVDGRPHGQEVKLAAALDQVFTATAESIHADPAAPAPTYAYHFAAVREAKAPGGVWRPLNSPRPVGSALAGGTSDDFTVASPSP